MRWQDIIQRLGAHLPPEDRERALVLEVEDCADTLKQVVDVMVALFEELELEDTRKV